MKKFFTLLLISSTVWMGSLTAQNTIDLETLMPQINADSLLRTVTDLQNFESRYALRPGGNHEVAEYLVNRLNNYGITAVIDTFHLSGQHWLVGLYDQDFYNVRGVLPASEPIDDSLVLIGAHLDAISYDHTTWQLLENAPGADDNASGVAVMIEMARICHANHLRFHRDIHFMAFDGEELGLFGGYYDAQKRNAAGEKIAVMINNDMVSYQPDENWRLMLHWYNNSLDVVSRAADLCAQYTDIDPYIPTLSENGSYNASDSYAYYQNGFRTVFAIEYTFSTSYHTDHDVADSNNYAYHADVARYNLAMLADYAELADGLGIEEQQDVVSLQVYPNPVSEKAVVRYQLTEASPVAITVTDMMGRVLLRQDISNQAAGIYLEEVDLARFSAGVYLCQLQTTKGVETVKLVKR